VAAIDDFIEWCRSQRDVNLEQAERYESGRQRLLDNEVDVSAEAIDRDRKIVADMTALIARAEREREA
jgi:hypothetical protein